VADPTYAEQLACAERELKYRGSRYKKWIAEGKMERQVAEHEYRCMRAIVGTLRRLADDEAQQGRLL
jgi:hypothetical protein